jgi:hypothetical protein
MREYSNIFGEPPVTAQPELVSSDLVCLVIFYIFIAFLLSDNPIRIFFFSFKILDTPPSPPPKKNHILNAFYFFIIICLASSAFRHVPIKILSNRIEILLLACSNL